MEHGSKAWSTDEKYGCLYLKTNWQKTPNVVMNIQQDDF